MNLTNFAGQNWLITPAALAVGEHPPANIHDQKWLLVLTGVVTANLKGNSTSQWLNSNVSFMPDMAGPSNSGPLTWAIGQYGIPQPAGPYTVQFSVDEWAPFVALSAIYDQSESIDAGYAVNVWRPNHFGTGTDAFTNAAIGNIFTGVNADVGVRDTDAWILNFSYNITLRGRIVFPKASLVTLFESNFGSTASGQRPSGNQAVGTATFNGANILVKSPPFPHIENWLKVGPYSVPDGDQFTGLFAETPGPGVYHFSAEMYVGSKSGDATIGFNSIGGQEFLNLTFNGQNQVEIFTQATNCIFPRDTPFVVHVTLNVTTTPATVQVEVGGISANANLPVYPGSVGAVTFYQAAGQANGFFVDEVLVTYTTM